MEIKQIKAHETWDLRQKVMWPNKDIEYVKLEEDHKGIHYGLYVEEKLVSAISLFFKGREAQFRKFATDTEQQRKGYGGILLQHAIREAISRGAQRIWCHARVEKVPFYKKFGMHEEGEVFKKDSKSYIRMSLT